MRARATAPLVAGVIACLLMPAVAEAGTPDQQQTTAGGTSAALWNSLSGGQTFTAGITGGLDQADLLLARQGAPSSYLTVEIRDVSGGMPGQSVLAARSIPASAITNTTAMFIPVQFNPPAPVVAGTQYGLVAYSGNPTGSNWFVWSASPASPDSYPGGAAYASTAPPGTWSTFGAGDFGFKTYVVPSPPAAVTPTPVAALTGQRAAALAKCKHKHGKKRKRCKHRANRLPV